MGKRIFNFQLNLASCCVVPPDMQQFAEENGIRLVTHNDPEVILGEKRLGTVKENKFRRLDWVVRYQVVKFIMFFVVFFCHAGCSAPLPAPYLMAQSIATWRRVFWCFPHKKK